MAGIAQQVALFEKFVAGICLLTLVSNTISDSFFTSPLPPLEGRGVPARLLKGGKWLRLSPPRVTEEATCDLRCDLRCDQLWKKHS